VHKRPVTWTGRGLRLAYVGNIVLAATAAIYFLNYSGRLAGFGFFIAGFVGLFSIQRMWLGRNEFGPDHARNARRGLLLFFAAAALFVYALVAGLTNVVETLNFRNMRPPVLALALALAFETSSLLVPSGGILLPSMVSWAHCWQSYCLPSECSSSGSSRLRGSRHQRLHRAGSACS
jgi:hypothetical protein